MDIVKYKTLVDKLKLLCIEMKNYAVKRWFDIGELIVTETDSEDRPDVLERLGIDLSVSKVSLYKACQFYEKIQSDFEGSLDYFFEQFKGIGWGEITRKVLPDKTRKTHREVFCEDKFAEIDAFALWSKLTKLAEQIDRGEEAGNTFSGHIKIVRKKGE